MTKGDWSNGMIGVSKTFGGSSILSSPVQKAAKLLQPGGFLCAHSCVCGLVGCAYTVI